MDKEEEIDNSRVDKIFSILGILMFLFGMFIIIHHIMKIPDDYTIKKAECTLESLQYGCNETIEVKEITIRGITYNSKTMNETILNNNCRIITGVTWGCKDYLVTKNK